MKCKEVKSKIFLQLIKQYTSIKIIKSKTKNYCVGLYKKSGGTLLQKDLSTVVLTLWQFPPGRKCSSCHTSIDIFHQIQRHKLHLVFDLKPVIKQPRNVSSLQLANTLKLNLNVRMAVYQEIPGKKRHCQTLLLCVGKWEFKEGLLKQTAPFIIL